LKKNRFGEYYIVTKKLLVKGKPYTVSQGRKNLDEDYGEWKLTRSQIVSILRNTSPSDWLFKSEGHFDGMIDGWVYDKEDWRPVNPGLAEWIINQIETFDYHIYFTTSAEDRFGNPQEQGVFEIYDIAIHSFMLKPRFPCILSD
jgi:hypothetical protein